MRQRVRIVLFFVLYSIKFFFSLFLFSNCLKYDNRRVGPGRNGTNAGVVATDETGEHAGGKGGIEGRAEEGSGDGQGDETGGRRKKRRT